MISSCRFRRPANVSGLERRRSASRALLVVTIGLATALGARPSDAQQRLPTRLVWDGAVCGSADDFEARVGQRTNAVRFVQRGQRLVVRARIERRGEGLDAQASIETRGRQPIVRRIASPDCDDALDALALVVAIGLEGSLQQQHAAPRARRRPPRREPPAAPTVATAPPPANGGQPPVEAPLEPEPTPPPGPAEPGEATLPVPPTGPPASEPPPLPPVVAPQPAPPREPGMDSRKPVPAPTQLELGVGLSGALTINVAPRPMLGGALWISAGWARGSIWSPELVLSAQHVRLDGLTRPEGRADFALTAGGLALCPLRLGNDVFALRPCASAAWGRLEVNGYDTFESRSHSRPWSALGATLEALARFGVVELRAAFGATAPLSRDSFGFAGPCIDPAACPADVFHHVAPVIWSGALGAGIRVW